MVLYFRCSSTHSLAIGQVLLDANYIECVIEKSANFVDGPFLYKFCAVASSTTEESNIKSALSNLFIHLLLLLLLFLTSNAYFVFYRIVSKDN